MHNSTETVSLMEIQDQSGFTRVAQLVVSRRESMTPKPNTRPAAPAQGTAAESGASGVHLTSKLPTDSAFNMPPEDPSISEDAWASTLGLPPQTISPTDVMSTSLDAESTRKNIPGFVTKLYRMVSEGTSNLIKWNGDGNTFIVTQPEEFARQVLPRFFKHNNFSSFVRQLNMYGFHKVPHIQQGTLVSANESSSQANSNSWEFSHPNFKRDRYDLLLQVKRKVSKEDETGATTSSSMTSPAAAVSLPVIPGGKDAKLAFETVLNEINSLRNQQEALRSDIASVQRENQMLWTETMAARERHLHQQQVIEKILRFLASIFASDKHVNAPSAAAGINRAKRQLLIQDSGPGRSLFAPSTSTANMMDHFTNHASALDNDDLYAAPTDYDQQRIFNFIDTTNEMGHDIDELQRRLDSGTLNEYMPALGENIRSIMPSPKKRKSSPVEIDAEMELPLQEDFDISRFLVDDDEHEGQH